MWYTNTRKEQTKVIVNFSDGGDGGTRVSRGGFLVDRNSWREAGDGVKIWFIHHAEKHPGIGGERLNVTPLSFSIDSIKSEAGFTGTGKTSDDDKLVAWDIEVDIFKVVLPSSAHLNAIIGGSALHFDSPFRQ